MLCFFFFFSCLLTNRPTSVQFCAKPCDVCIMLLLSHSVYSVLRLCLSNSSHEDTLSPHAGILMCLFNSISVPEGCHTSHIWRIPTNWRGLTVNSGSPHGPWVQPRWILFPKQTYLTHQTEKPRSCTQTPNNRFLNLGQKRLGPLIGERSIVNMWANIYGAEFLFFGGIFIFHRINHLWIFQNTFALFSYQHILCLII